MPEAAASSFRGDVGEGRVDPGRTVGADLARRREQMLASPKLLLIGVFVVYVLAVAAITLDSRTLAPGAMPYNVVPLRSIALQLQSTVSPAHKVFQFGGNVAMLMPLGLVLACVFARRRVLAVLLICAMTSLVIEVLQYLVPTGRSADVDDILLNALGGLAGYLLGRAVITSARAGASLDACRS